MNIEELRDLPVDGDEYLEEEKETYFHILETEKNQAIFSTKMPSFIKYFLRCDDVEITRYHTDKDGNLIHLEGKMPVTYLNFRNRPKAQNYLSRAL